MELLPSSLTFELAVENPSCSFKVKNVSNEDRAFSIRTTNLLNVFKFKPAKALIVKGESIKVVATLSEEKRQVLVRRREYRCKDEFMIVSMPVSEEVVAEYQQTESAGDARVLLEMLFKEGIKTKRTKMIFTAFFIPPVQRHISAFQERAMRSCLGRSCFRSAAQLSDGSVRLSATDIVINPLGRRGPSSPITIFNRCEYYVMYSVMPTSASIAERFLIEPFAKGIVEPREAATLLISLSGKEPSASPLNTIRTFVSASEVSNRGGEFPAQEGEGPSNPSENVEPFAVICTTVTDPDLIDLAMNVSTKEDRDKVFNEFWQSISERPSHELWQGSFRCHVIHEAPSRGSKLGRRLSSHSIVANSKSSSTILGKATSAQFSLDATERLPAPQVGDDGDKRSVSPQLVDTRIQEIPEENTAASPSALVPT